MSRSLETVPASKHVEIAEGNETQALNMSVFDKVRTPEALQNGTRMLKKRAANPQAGSSKGTTPKGGSPAAGGGGASSAATEAAAAGGDGGSGGSGGGGAAEKADDKGGAPDLLASGTILFSIFIFIFNVCFL